MKKHIKSLNTLTDSELNLIDSFIKKRSLKKGDFLIREGQICKDTDIESLVFYIYYSLNDLSGKSSVDFLAENITHPFNFYKDNRATPVRYFGNGKSIFLILILVS